MRMLACALIILTSMSAGFIFIGCIYPSTYFGELIKSNTFSALEACRHEPKETVFVSNISPFLTELTPETSHINSKLPDTQTSRPRSTMSSPEPTSNFETSPTYTHIQPSNPIEIKESTLSQIIARISIVELAKTVIIALAIVWITIIVSSIDNKFQKNNRNSLSN